MTQFTVFDYIDFFVYPIFADEQQNLKKQLLTKIATEHQTLKLSVIKLKLNN